MAKLYSDAEQVEQLAQSLIGTYHPHLVEAVIRYLFVDKGSMMNNRPVYGKVSKCNDAIKHLLGADFIIVVALDHYNELDENQRRAALDHLLEHCVGEEDEDNAGVMHYSVRKPDVQEFTSIVRRHGVWQEGLRDFVTVAKAIDIDGLDALVETDQTTTQGTTPAILPFHADQVPHVGYEVPPDAVCRRPGATGNGDPAQETLGGRDSPGHQLPVFRGARTG